MSGDRILRAFLEKQLEEVCALQAESDLLEIVPLGVEAPQHYLVGFHCKGLVKNGQGQIVEANQFAVAIRFPDDYLRRVDPFSVLSWVAPPNVFHPNIGERAPIICVGHIVPGTPLVALIYQVFEIITYQNFTPREDNALNPAACSWARNNLHRFPIDPRGLKRRALRLQVTQYGSEGLHSSNKTSEVSE